MTTAFLKSHPNYTARISDDEDAAMLLFELGILEKLKKQSAESRAFSPTGSAAMFHQKFGSHWICAVLYHGSKRKEDDGFIVQCLPKSEFTQSEAQAEFQRMFSAAGGYVARSHTAPTSKPDAN